MAQDGLAHAHTLERLGPIVVLALILDAGRSHHLHGGSADQLLLQRILLETPGVFGSRFSGAGYGGCSVALVEADAAQEACARVEREYVGQRPELAGRARAFLVESEDGARLV